MKILACSYAIRCSVIFVLTWCYGFPRATPDPDLHRYCPHFWKRREKWKLICFLYGKLYYYLDMYHLCIVDRVVVCFLKEEMVLWWRPLRLWLASKTTNTGRTKASSGIGFVVVVVVSVRIFNFGNWNDLLCTMYPRPVLGTYISL